MIALQPSTSISTQLIIEIPVISIDNNTLFDTDLGTSKTNY